jgi:hypothetical protein
MALTLEKAVHDLEHDGVTIISNVFRPEQIDRFRAQYDRLFTRAMDIVQRGSEDSYELITHFDKEVRANKTAFADGEGGVIIETAPGRNTFEIIVTPSCSRSCTAFSRVNAMAFWTLTGLYIQLICFYFQ